MSENYAELYDGFNEFVRALPAPVIVDIGGTEHHGKAFERSGDLGSLICVNPTHGDVWQYGNVVYMHGDYTHVALPEGLADEVQFNMIVTYVLGQYTYSPIDVVMKAIETAKKFAKPGTWLDVLDMNPTTEQVAMRLQKKGLTIEYRALNPENDEDRAFCNSRSYDASMHWSGGLGLLRIQL